jgi:hypothetical protein
MAKVEIDDLIAAVKIVTELQVTAKEQDDALIAIQAEMQELDKRIRALEIKQQRKHS